MLCATVITHNEERNIERCLNSLLGVADEIVVVDAYSDDATVEICRRYGARVTLRHFSGYGPQRQYAAGLASASYVLSIDADEVLSPELRDNIIALKAEGFRHRMYAFRVVNYICGHAMRRSGMEPRVSVRLFDKRYASWDMLDVGERLSHPGSVMPVLVEGDLNHYRCNDAAELEFKELRNARMRGRMLAAAGISAPRAMQLLRAASDYLRCQLRQGAIFDGETGRMIARARFKATLEAYRTAREITLKADSR